MNTKFQRGRLFLGVHNFEEYQIGWLVDLCHAETIGLGICEEVLNPLCLFWGWMFELTQEVERLQQQVADLGHNSKAFGRTQMETRCIYGYILRKKSRFQVTLFQSQIRSCKQPEGEGDLRGISMDFLSDQTLGELVAQVDAFAIPFPPCLGGRKMEKKVGGWKRIHKIRCFRSLRAEEFDAWVYVKEENIRYHGMMQK